MEGLFGDGLVLFCCRDSLEEDLRWEPRLGAFVDLVELLLVNRFHALVSDLRGNSACLRLVVCFFILTG